MVKINKNNIILQKPKTPTPFKQTHQGIKNAIYKSKITNKIATT